MRRAALALTALAAAALLGAACTGNDQGAGSSGNSGGLSDYLPAAPGYQLPSTVATQEVMDSSEAANALPSDHSATAQELQNLNYQSGFARIWGTSTDYVTMIVLALPSVPGARAFVAFERSALANAQNTFVTAHQDIPGSFVFVISSPTVASGNQQSELCNGVWFAYRTYAFESLACGSTPSWATQIEEAAKALYQRAVERAPG